MDTRIPVELNWVEKRAACTVATVFNQLCDGIRDDVAAFNAVSGLDETGRFRADMHSSGTTVFIAQPNRVPRPIVSVGIVDDKHIAVKQDWDGKTWKANLGLNDEGRCILRLDKDGTELEQWQFRKKALESLLFGGKA